MNAIDRHLFVQLSISIRKCKDLFHWNPLDLFELTISKSHFEETMQNDDDFLLDKNKDFKLIKLKKERRKNLLRHYIFCHFYKEYFLFLHRFDRHVSSTYGL